MCVPTQHRDVRIPTAQSFINYALLSLNGLYWLWKKRHHHHQSQQHQSPTNNINDLEHSAVSDTDPNVPSTPVCATDAQQSRYSLSVPWWHYALLALADVEGNFFLVKSYEYTSITSVQLLDCFTIPVVMVCNPTIWCWMSLPLSLSLSHTFSHSLSVFCCCSFFHILCSAHATHGDT
jgi:Solute carrier family 35